MTPSLGEARDTELSEKLSFRWVLNIFLRTWPFIRPSLKHFGIFLALSGIVALVGLFLTFVVFGFTTTGIVGGDPVGSVPVAVWGLDPDVYVNVEELTDEARRGLIWPSIITTIVLLGIGVGAGVGLSYYSIWIFQQVNQRMRLELIDRLQAQSLQFHANAKAGDAIYRVYQDSAMVTGLVRSILLEPVLFLGRYVVGLVVVAAFDPFLALVLALAVPPILYLGYKFFRPIEAPFQSCTREQQRTDFADSGKRARHPRHQSVPRGSRARCRFPQSFAGSTRRRFPCPRVACRARDSCVRRDRTRHAYGGVRGGAACQRQRPNVWPVDSPGLWVCRLELRIVLHGQQSRQRGPRFDPGADRHMGPGPGHGDGFWGASSSYSTSSRTCRMPPTPSRSRASRMACPSTR